MFHVVQYSTKNKISLSMSTMSINLRSPEGENSYYHPAIISTITCAALMRVRFVSVRRSVTMAALKHIFRPINLPITSLFFDETIKCEYSFSYLDRGAHFETKFEQFCRNFFCFA